MWWVVIMAGAVIVPLALSSVVPLPRWKPESESLAVPASEAPVVMETIQKQPPIVIPPLSEESMEAARVREVEQRLKALEPRVRAMDSKLDLILENEAARSSGRSHDGGQE